MSSRVPQARLGAQRFVLNFLTIVSAGSDGHISLLPRSALAQWNEGNPSASLLPFELASKKGFSPKDTTRFPIRVSSS